MLAGDGEHQRVKLFHDVRRIADLVNQLLEDFERGLKRREQQFSGDRLLFLVQDVLSAELTAQCSSLGYLLSHARHVLLQVAARR